MYWNKICFVRSMFVLNNNYLQCKLGNYCVCQKIELDQRRCGFNSLKIVTCVRYL